MIKILSILCLCFFLGGNVFSQEDYSVQYGKVTDYEMSMTEYEKDKDAEALVIYDVGVNHFLRDNSRGFLLCMERVKKIKILKEAGIKYANIEIPYYKSGRDSEVVEDIEGITYNLENGQVVKTNLVAKQVFQENVRDDYFVKKIALSDVREGSIIEFKYKITTPFFFNMRKWEVQQDIPVVNSKLIYRAVPYYVYTFVLRGAREFDEFGYEDGNTDINFGTLSYRERTFRFGMKDVPAFRDEEFIASPQNYKVAIDFQLSKSQFPGGMVKEYMSTWPDMCDSFLGDVSFGKYIKGSEKEAKKILPALNIADQSPLEQAIAISEYVRTMYTWNEFNGKYADCKLQDFLKQKTGNVANINLFLIGMLKAAKIEVNPVVLSTRRNGIVHKQFPFQQFLNYVIAEVVIDNNKYYIDATDPLVYFDEMPERCTNVEGLVVKPKSEEWAFVVQKKVSETIMVFNLNPVPDEQKTKFDLSVISKGNDAYRYRNRYKNKESNLSDYLKKSYNINEYSDMKIENYEDRKEPFNFLFKSSMSLEGVQDKLFIHPFCNISIRNNPFKQNSRTFQVDLMHIRSERYQSTIKIPEGYKVEHMPAELRQDTGTVKINYIPEIKGDSIIVITADYTLKRNVYEAEDYLKLKDAFSRLIKQFSEMIVLIKEK